MAEQMTWISSQKLGGGSNDDEETKTSVVAGVNLVLIMSALSLSAEDASSFEGIQETETEESLDEKQRNLRKSTRMQQLKQFPAVDRLHNHNQTKISDSR